MKLTNNRMIIGASLLMMTFSLSVAKADVTCPSIPSCSDLGYISTDCGTGISALKCPFDQTKLFCGQDCKDFKLDSCPANANCVRCGNGKYKLNSCNAGYTMNDDWTACNLTDCEEVFRVYQDPEIIPNHGLILVENNSPYMKFPTKYMLTSKSDPNCVNYQTCQSGNTTYYVCMSCANDLWAPGQMLYKLADNTKCSRMICPSANGWLYHDLQVKTNLNNTGWADGRIAIGWAMCVPGGSASADDIMYRPVGCIPGLTYDVEKGRCTGTLGSTVYR